MKHVRMTHSGRGPLHTYYYLEWMYDQMRHGDYCTSYGMWYTIANAYVQCWARERSSGRKRKEYIKKIIHAWVEGNIRLGIEYNSKHEWYRGCKPCDFFHLPGYGKEVYHIREIIKQWNKFAKPSRRFYVDFDGNDGKYNGIPYDKCLQILTVLNVKRK